LENKRFRDVCRDQKTAFSPNETRRFGFPISPRFSNFDFTQKRSQFKRFSTRRFPALIRRSTRRFQRI
jgi:hypothetical protein